jgi:hypothetical protein
MAGKGGFLIKKRKLAALKNVFVRRPPAASLVAHLLQKRFRGVFAL